MFFKIIDLYFCLSDQKGLGPKWGKLEVEKKYFVLSIVYKMIDIQMLRKVHRRVKFNFFSLNFHDVEWRLCISMHRGKMKKTVFCFPD